MPEPVENFKVVKDSYRTFKSSPGGINLWNHLEEREKGLMHEAQQATDPLVCLTKTQRAAAISEIRNYLDGLASP